jgi:dipeptidase
MAKSKEKKKRDKMIHWKESIQKEERKERRGKFYFDKVWLPETVIRGQSMEISRNER